MLLQINHNTLKHCFYQSGNKLGIAKNIIKLFQPHLGSEHDENSLLGQRTCYSAYNSCKGKLIKLATIPPLDTLKYVQNLY